MHLAFSICFQVYLTCIKCCIIASFSHIILPFFVFVICFSVSLEFIAIFIKNMRLYLLLCIFMYSLSSLIVYIPIINHGLLPILSHT